MKESKTYNYDKSIYYFIKCYSNFFYAIPYFVHTGQLFPSCWIRQTISIGNTKLEHE